MHWFVFFLGACLTVAGGASLVSSIDLIGVERGTVLAVAGTIALTGGVLTLALGFLLMSLRQLSGRLRETGPVKTYTGANGEKASAYPEMASAAAGIAFCALEQAQPFMKAGVVDHATQLYQIPESTSRWSTRSTIGNQDNCSAAR